MCSWFYCFIGVDRLTNLRLRVNLGWYECFCLIRCLPIFLPSDWLQIKPKWLKPNWTDNFRWWYSVSERWPPELQTSDHRQHYSISFRWSKTQISEIGKAKNQCPLVMFPTYRRWENFLMYVVFSLRKWNQLIYLIQHRLCLQNHEFT